MKNGNQTLQVYDLEPNDQKDKTKRAILDDSANDDGNYGGQSIGESENKIVRKS